MVSSPGAHTAEQNLAQTPLPDAALFAEQEQLRGGQADSAEFGPSQLRSHRQPVGGQSGHDTVGESFGPAMFAGPGQGGDLLAAGAGQIVGRGPALQQLEEDRAAQVAVGDVDGGREDGDQVSAQPVGQAALVAGGSVVVAGDRAQLGTEHAVRDELTQFGVLVQRDQAADPGVFGVVLLLGRPPRRATRSGLTGSTVNPASTSASTSRP